MICFQDQNFLSRSTNEDMTMSSSDSGKRKSDEANGEDKIRNAEKKRKETEDDEDIMIVENDDEEIDSESIRKKWTKKYLVFLKEYKGNIKKLRHMVIICLFNKNKCFFLFIIIILLYTGKEILTFETSK